MNRPELLAPSGSPEALVAAVQAGADAVYLGFGDFNARRNARNFTAENLAETVAYCHLRGVKVYLTMNTLLTDRELPAAAECARTAARAGVDAVLVQDLGVMTLLQSVAPTLPLHASTQMSLHTLGGVTEAARLGFTRAVVARELSGAELRSLTEKAPIETEYFVHGALCMCYSGECAFSALLGGRSGNRGLCAQPCRLPYRVGSGKTGHPLSLKDNCLAACVPALAEAGVASLKLEGRMKRPEYVALVTDVYARLLRENRPATEAERRDLAAIFSRSGFTDGYYTGKTGKTMFGTRPESETEPPELLARARALYEKEDRRRVPVSLSCSLTREGSSLTAEDGDGNLVCVSGERPEAARTRALTEEDVSARLKKTGGTAFTVESVSVALEEGLMLSAAALNELRRRALQGLAARRTAVSPPLLRETPDCERGEEITQPPRLTVSLLRASQCSAELLACRPETVYLPIEEFSSLSDAFLASASFCAVLPRVWRDAEEPRLRAWLAEAERRGVRAVTVGNLGHLSLLDGFSFARYGDYALRIFNSRALAFCRHAGLSRAALSFELRAEQIRDLEKTLPTEAIVYGRLPLMLTENCVTAIENDCAHGDGSFLTDRTGAVFPVTCAYGCRTEIQNSRPLFLADRDDWRRIGLSYARLRFTTETAEECVTVLRRYRNENDFTPPVFTRGLFSRGVE